MEFDNIETIKRSVKVGSGLSIRPETTRVLNETEERAGCRCVTSSRGRSLGDVGVIHRRGRVLSAAAGEFVKLLIDQPRALD